MKILATPLPIDTAELKNKRIYKEVKSFKPYAGKKVRIHIIGKIEGKNTLDTNFRIFITNQKNDTTNSYDIIFKDTTYDTFFKEFLLLKDVNEYTLYMKYPSLNYNLRILKFDLLIELDGNWYNLDSMAKNIIELRPRYNRLDYIFDSLHYFSIGYFYKI